MLAAMKLDRMLGHHLGIGRRQARLLIANGQVSVDGETELRNDREVDRFSRIIAAGQPAGTGAARIFIMLHKPAGILSATCDPVHRTVIDLIDHPAREQLHLAGRLDRSSSGLVLLTSDGRWSSRLMDPDRKVPKVYLVTTATPLPADAAESFARGFHFHTEDIVTRPALLEVLEPCLVRITLHEGRYHQIKRMIHRVGSRVTSLHRESIGPLSLDTMQPGKWRHLLMEEAEALWNS